MELHWRKANSSDLQRINEIADRIHTGLPERPEVFEEKVRLCPEACLVLLAGDEIVGYGISHPWKLHQIPPLDTFLENLPPNPDCIYVHDVVVLPEFRGKLAVGMYIEVIAQLAKAMNIGSLALVSVYDTDPLWSRFGFRVVPPDTTLSAKLQSYGETAKYMICDLIR
ncbi:GNAT family N-acetyltransferase [Bradyrhizobium sp.]|uniref:GNAT family N-acetyltransferase n=1 Tax=Bradyrhizobium sp. TaxID=376 RepID=UPI002D62CDD4|nr:GNAT family N-acetyltransferase [Bradyrhizobium sp.]HZR75129.1 GNAT family N-acetyltransferase [Bradyrhizobium sp.]